MINLFKNIKMSQMTFIVHIMLIVGLVIVTIKGILNMSRIYYSVFLCEKW